MPAQLLSPSLLASAYVQPILLLLGSNIFMNIGLVRTSAVQGRAETATMPALEAEGNSLPDTRASVPPELPPATAEPRGEELNPSMAPEFICERL